MDFVELTIKVKVEKKGDVFTHVIPKLDEVLFNSEFIEDYHIYQGTKIIVSHE